MIIKAPAKVNLHLAVLDKRPDGFHNLESFFTAVDFGDILHFEPINGEENAMELAMEWPKTAGFRQGEGGFPVEKNIIFKAFSLFRRKVLSKEKGGFSLPLKIRVEKHIPIGGGLGGGSSDAASALMALNQLAGYPLEQAELLELGAALGSDVPFFIHRVSAAWVTGRGEEIEPLKPPPWHFVLVNPGFASDTGRAFKLLDESRKVAENREQRAGSREKGKVIFTNNKAHYSLLTAHCSLSNDFLPVFPEPEKSTYNKIIGQLTGLGAEFAGLSGTGSTCFGAFKEKEQAEKAALSLRGEWGFAQTCSVENFC